MKDVFDIEIEHNAMISIYKALLNYHNLCKYSPNETYRAEMQKLGESIKRLVCAMVDAQIKSFSEFNVVGYGLDSSQAE